jgi:hypothetical protein
MSVCDGGLKRAGSWTDDAACHVQVSGRREPRRAAESSDLQGVLLPLCQVHDLLCWRRVCRKWRSVCWQLCRGRLCVGMRPSSDQLRVFSLDVHGVQLVGARDVASGPRVSSHPRSTHMVVWGGDRATAVESSSLQEAHSVLCKALSLAVLEDRAILCTGSRLDSYASDFSSRLASVDVGFSVRLVSCTTALTTVLGPHSPVHMHSQPGRKHC